MTLRREYAIISGIMQASLLREHDYDRMEIKVELMFWKVSYDLRLVAAR